MSTRHRLSCVLACRLTGVKCWWHRPIDIQGCPGSDPNDPTPGDFPCEQVVAIRFPQVDVPEGSRITRAYLSFDVDETDECTGIHRGEAGACREELEDGSLVTGESSAVTLWIQGSAEDDAAPICPEGVNGCQDMRAPQGSILNRPRTNARVEWSPTPWTVVHQVQRSVDVAPILQELVSRPGWLEGNSVMMILGKASGAGTRVAEADRTAMPSLTYSFTFSGLEVENYATPQPGTLSLDRGGRCLPNMCVDDDAHGAHTEVLTTQACADLCSSTEGCVAFEYQPWTHQCRLDAVTLDLSGEDALRRSTTQFYYERLEAGGHAVAPCQDTSAINAACPGAQPGQVVPRACGAACADVFMPWWNRCQSDEAVAQLDSSCAAPTLSPFPPLLIWRPRFAARNGNAFTHFSTRCGKHYHGGGH